MCTPKTHNVCHCRSAALWSTHSPYLVCTAMQTLHALGLHRIQHLGQQCCMCRTVHSPQLGALKPRRSTCNPLEITLLIALTWYHSAFFSAASTYIISLDACLSFHLHAKRLQMHCLGPLSHAVSWSAPGLLSSLLPKWNSRIHCGLAQELIWIHIARHCHACAAAMHELAPKEEVQCRRQGCDPEYQGPKRKEERQSQFEELLSSGNEALQ